MRARPDSELSDQDLRPCTVKIDVDRLPRGTGFFVAPGHVITCAHVLAALDVGNPAVRAELIDGRAFLAPFGPRAQRATIDFTH
jgi:hypothetical protein